VKTYSGKYKIDLILVGVGLATLLFLFVAELWLYWYGGYWEGLDVIPFGSWLWLLPNSFFAGLPLLAAFVIRMLVRVRKDRAVVSLTRLLLGVGLLVGAPLVCFVGLLIGGVLPMPREPGMVRFAKGFRDRIDRKCSPEEIRAWAESFVEERGEDADCYELKGDQIPCFVKKIYPTSHFGRFVRVSVKDGVVEVFWGSPLPGHWGLAIGPQDMWRPEGMGQNETEDMCFFKWKPGIYIWHSED